MNFKHYSLSVLDAAQDQLKNTHKGYIGYIYRIYKGIYKGYIKGYIKDI